MWRWSTTATRTVEMAQVDEEAIRSLVESIVRRIDSAARVLLREPGRNSVLDTLRLAVISRGLPMPFDVTAVEWRDASSPVGRERLARRLGATLGLQPPDQLVGPPRS